MLYTYINSHAKTPKPVTKNTMRLGTGQVCYIGSRIGWVSVLHTGVVVVV